MRYKELYCKTCDKTTEHTEVPLEVEMGYHEFNCDVCGTFRFYTKSDAVHEHAEKNRIPELALNRFTH